MTNDEALQQLKKVRNGSVPISELVATIKAFDIAVKNLELIEQVKELTDLYDEQTKVWQKIYEQNYGKDKEPIFSLDKLNSRFATSIQFLMNGEMNYKKLKEAMEVTLSLLQSDIKE